MNDLDILSQLEDAVRTVIDEYEGPVTLETSAADIEKRDGLPNVKFIVMPK